MFFSSRILLLRDFIRLQIPQFEPDDRTEINEFSSFHVMYVYGHFTDLQVDVSHND